MKTHKPFVHLHTHSHYSVLDGMIKIPDLIKTVKDLQFPAIAITEHGNLFSAIEFYKTAVKEGVKPILGMEAYIAPQSRFTKEKIKGNGEKQHIAHHIILLAKNFEGYQNLLKLSSASYIEGFYYKPRIDKELLKEHSSGLIALSSCIQGEIAYSIIHNNFMHARRTAYEFKELFGDDFYLELQNHGLEKEGKAMTGLLRLSKELDIPLVATNDVHYLTREDYEAHDILLCMQMQKKIDDPDRIKMATNEFYLKSYEEMADLFKAIPEAVENTIKIMDKCNLILEFGKMQIPRYPLSENINSEEYLETLALKGLKERYDQLTLTEEVQEQLHYELDIVKKMHFVDYFLIVWDYINFAKQNSIMVGAGRGSAAGSILAYALGITDVDPIKYGLFFERFLNPDRISPPDIDIDFEDTKRDKVIEYVINKYGQEKTAHIITFNKFKAKAAFKAVARVLNVSFSVSNSISKLINQNSLEESYKGNQELIKIIEKDENLKNIWKISLKLENICSSVGTHAAGIVISNEPIVNSVPFYMDQKEKTISTQYDMDIIKSVGLVKFDFLGLKNLSIIKDCVKLIKDTENISIDIENLPLDNKETYRIMQKGLTKGIFQIENTGITDLFCKAKPKTFPEIGVLIALYRPGPINSGMMDSYVRRKNKIEEVSYIHKSLKPILEETFGVVVYQEQVMSITRIIGGFTLGEADLIRRAMGKKKLEIIHEQKEKFLEGAKKNKFDLRLAESIFTDLAKFAEYAFNKAHSVAYAFITYQTAYLKALYPAEFFAALLSNEMDKIENITKYYSEVQKFKIMILPPDINKSIAVFNVTPVADEKNEVKKVINFGLAGIKNVGEKLIGQIIDEREKNGTFKNIMDFLVRLDSKLVNKKILEGLIKAGAFDALDIKRKTLFDNIDLLIEESYKIKKNIESGQMNLFMGKSQKNDDHSYILKNVIQDSTEWPKNELLKYEREVLG
ncbi:MAG: DNA polymerase III subunit alpha, partial [Spirochaetes bacterium]|nr:DNA polymerase III subunit alpha [Spirochaetota bacterium]